MENLCLGMQKINIPFCIQQISCGVLKQLQYQIGCNVFCSCLTTWHVHIFHSRKSWCGGALHIWAGLRFLNQGMTWPQSLCEPHCKPVCVCVSVPTDEGPAGRGYRAAACSLSCLHGSYRGWVGQKTLVLSIRPPAHSQWKTTWMDFNELLKK